MPRHPYKSEFGHIGTGLGDDDIGGEATATGDGADQVPEAAKGLHHHLDPLGERVDGRGVLIDQIRVCPVEEYVVTPGTLPGLALVCGVLGLWGCVGRVAFVG